MMLWTTIRAAYLHSLNRPRSALKFGIRALRAIWFAASHPPEDTLASEQTARRRLAACEQCPIYDLKWKACGDGQHRLKNGDYVGCLCYMPFKVHLTHATCWLHEQGLTELGWPQP